MRKSIAVTGAAVLAGLGILAAGCSVAGSAASPAHTSAPATHSAAPVVPAAAPSTPATACDKLAMWYLEGPGKGQVATIELVLASAQSDANAGDQIAVESDGGDLVAVATRMLNGLPAGNPDFASALQYLITAGTDMQAGDFPGAVTALETAVPLLTSAAAQIKSCN